ncbi:YugN-like family protein [Alkalihalobacterium elongatum]|uniref:YugN-like family protein n=1 Tax=Alkalihalobacterium elongatum TaxID=2675466 RepID=UPI001C1FDEBF|nr:YugN-like family protein [Alkalihalobacterium elongatum]
MIQLNSAIENKQFKLQHLEEKLKPLGYVIGGNWDYDHGFFDYKVDQTVGNYVFLRVPFKAVDGELDQKGVKVELGKPFLLNHDFQESLDDNILEYNSFMNQFAEPENKDAEVPQDMITSGQSLVQELEATLLFFPK